MLILLWDVETSRFKMTWLDANACIFLSCMLQGRHQKINLFLLCGRSSVFILLYPIPHHFFIFCSCDPELSVRWLQHVAVKLSLHQVFPGFGIKSFPVLAAKLASLPPYTSITLFSLCLQFDSQMETIRLPLPVPMMELRLCFSWLEAADKRCIVQFQPGRERRICFANHKAAFIWTEMEFGLDCDSV